MSLVGPEDDLMVVTDQGTIIRLPINQVRAYSRAAKGVRIIDARGQEVVSSHAVPSGEPEAKTDIETKVSEDVLDDPDMDALAGAGEDE